MQNNPSPIIALSVGSFVRWKIPHLTCTHNYQINNDKNWRKSPKIQKIAKNWQKQQNRLKMNKKIQKITKNYENCWKWRKSPKMTKIVKNYKHWPKLQKYLKITKMPKIADFLCFFQIPMAWAPLDFYCRIIGIGKRMHSTFEIFYNKLMKYLPENKYGMFLWICLMWRLVWKFSGQISKLLLYLLKQTTHMYYPDQVSLPWLNFRL